MFQVGVGASGLWVSGTEFAPDQAVAERQGGAHQPSEDRLRAAHHSDDQGQRDEGAHSDHIDDVEAECSAGRQPAMELIWSGLGVHPALAMIRLPKRAVPTRTQVLPSSIATWKSFDIPMDNCVSFGKLASDWS